MIKPTLKTFGIAPLKMKFYVRVDEDEFRNQLGKTIDNLLRMNVEIVGESWEYHEKKFRGTIRSNFFEAKSIQEMGLLWTYNPWVIRGDFKGIGSNVELSVKSEPTDSLRQSRMIFLVFPFILFFGTLITRDLSQPSSIYSLVVCVLIVILYHLVSRWSQFTAIRNFLNEFKGEEISIERDFF